MAPPLTFSIASGETVYQGDPISINCSEAVATAQNAVTIRQDGKQLDVLVSIDNDHKAIKVPTTGLVPGRYTLAVNELLKKDSQGRLADFYYGVEFIISTKPLWHAALPANLKLLHIVDIHLDKAGTRRLLPGEAEARHLQRVKAIDSKTGMIHDLAFENGDKIDVKPILAKLEEHEFRKAGRVHEMLQRQISEEKPENDVKVIVWPQMKDVPGYTKVPGQPPQEYLDAHQQILAAKPRIAGLIREIGGTVTYTPDDFPFMHATVPISRIQELARSADVGGLFYDDPTSATDLGNSIAIAGSDIVMTQGHKAKDVRIAIFEDGPSNTRNLEFAGRYSSKPVDSDHARLTSAIVKNVEPGKSNGHAPNSSLYSANSFDVRALAWALESEQQCSVVSQSFHRSGEPVSGYIQADDILKDYFATNWPYPTIVQAAGNYWAGDGRGVDPPSNEYVNHKGYNTLTVGNHDDSGTVMSGDSTFRNPISTHADRELPEVAANGTAVASNEQFMSGTSLSASAVAGVVGLVQGINDSLKLYPEACRAIILASAKRSLADGSWWGDVTAGIDAKCGAGALDAQTAMSIAVERITDLIPRASGWGWASVTAMEEESEGVKANYMVEVPSIPVSASSTSTTAFIVKAAIAWCSKVKSDTDRRISSVLELDLDLIIRDSEGSIVAYSSSLDNSYEVVEFHAMPGTNYKLEVVHASGKGTTWAGTAWTVRKVDRLVR
ncbi:peptidase S8/S53 domain-containing protein [Xylaria sp. CBS 124048]|nr:peptidase S8/S53 domain-containing protein [Xylaria sp. CBS 124048]